MPIERSAEAEAFLTTVDTVPPDAVSACAGWTTHEVLAHVVGNAIEVSRHLAPFLAGDPVPATRSFEEREAPLRALPHADLVRRLDVEDARFRGLVADALDAVPDAVIPWTGRRMAVASFVTHLRNDHALHRWDLVGDDEVSARLLGRDDLVAHSVSELGRLLLVAGRRHDPDPDTEFRVRLHSPGAHDLQVIVGDGNATLSWAHDDADGPTVELDRAARHLFVWGRRSERHGRARSRLAPSDLARLQALLSGY